MSQFSEKINIGYPNKAGIPSIDGIVGVVNVPHIPQIIIDVASFCTRTMNKTVPHVKRKKRIDMTLSDIDTNSDEMEYNTHNCFSCDKKTPRPGNYCRKCIFKQIRRCKDCKGPSFHMWNKCAVCSGMNDTVIEEHYFYLTWFNAKTYLDSIKIKGGMIEVKTVDDEGNVTIHGDNGITKTISADQIAAKNNSGWESSANSNDGKVFTNQGWVDPSTLPKPKIDDKKNQTNNNSHNIKSNKSENFVDSLVNVGINNNNVSSVNNSHNNTHNRTNKYSNRKTNVKVNFDNNTNKTTKALQQDKGKQINSDEINRYKKQPKSDNQGNNEKDAKVEWVKADSKAVLISKSSDSVLHNQKHLDHLIELNKPQTISIKYNDDKVNEKVNRYKRTVEERNYNYNYNQQQSKLQFTNSADSSYGAARNQYANINEYNRNHNGNNNKNIKQKRKKTQRYRVKNNPINRYFNQYKNQYGNYNDNDESSDSEIQQPVVPTNPADADQVLKKPNLITNIELVQTELDDDDKYCNINGNMNLVKKRDFRFLTFTDLNNKDESDFNHDINKHPRFDITRQSITIKNIDKSLRPIDDFDSISHISQFTLYTYKVRYHLPQSGWWPFTVRSETINRTMKVSMEHLTMLLDRKTFNPLDRLSDIKIRMAAKLRSFSMISYNRYQTFTFDTIMNDTLEFAMMFATHDRIINHRFRTNTVFQLPAKRSSLITGIISSVTTLKLQNFKYPTLLILMFIFLKYPTMKNTRIGQFLKALAQFLLGPLTPNLILNQQ